MRPERPNDLSAFWLPFTPNRHFKANPRMIVGAEGMYFFDPAGRKLIAKIFPDHSRRIAEIMGRLNSAEQQQLGDLCRKLGKGLQS